MTKLDLFLLHGWELQCFWGEWPSGLRCSKNWRLPGSNPTRHLARLRDPTSLQDSRWPSGRKCKTQWLTSGKWGCPLNNDPKLAVRYPNSSFKKINCWVWIVQKSVSSGIFFMRFIFFFFFFLLSWTLFKSSEVSITFLRPDKPGVHVL